MVTLRSEIGKADGKETRKCARYRHRGTLPEGHYRRSTCPRRSKAAGVVKAAEQDPQSRVRVPLPKIELTYKVISNLHRYKLETKNTNIFRLAPRYLEKAWV